MTDEGELVRVAQRLASRFGLEALIVFGSEAKGSSRPGSDLDLAALFRERPGEVALLETRADLERLLGREVDLVDLSTASPILAMQVLRTGRCVFGARSPTLAALAASLPSRYADLKRVRAPAEAALADRILHGRP